MKKFSSLYFKAWRPELIMLSLATIAYLLYFHNIIHLLPGYDARELRVYANAANWHTIVSNPINAPYKVVVWLGAVMGHHSVAQARVAAGCFGLLAGLLFYSIIRKWYGFGIAFLTTIMFTTSAGFLHFARLGSAQILQMSILVFIAAVLSYQRYARKHALLTGYALVLLVAVLLYVPGMIWPEIFGLVLIRKGLVKQLFETPKLHRSLWAALFVLVIAPLIYASAKAPSVLMSVVGLPSQIHLLNHVLTNFYRTLLAIGVRGTADPEFFVGHSPLLSIVEFALAAIGIIHYARRVRAPKGLFLIGTAVISIVLISLGGAVGLAMLLPLLYLFVATGLDELLGQWLGVFPRNPIARIAGVSVVVIMLFFSTLYQIRSYFVAWPHNAATRQNFNLPQPPPPPSATIYTNH